MREGTCGSEKAEQECLVWLALMQEDADREGCEPELRQYLQCANEEPTECRGIIETPVEATVSRSCNPEHEVFYDCVSDLPANCSITTDALPENNFCSINCGEFVSVCERASAQAPLDCRCETGLFAGTAFEAVDCGREFSHMTDDYCH